MEQQEALLDDGSPSPRPPTPILPVGDGCTGEGDSSSAGSVLPADAVSAQLINNITMLDYHSLGKTTTLIDDPEDIGATNGMGIGPTVGQLPQFVTWNWPLIRRFLFWVVLSAIFACVATVVGMVATLPRTCNPVLPWYQGQLFYEIFPASFQDTNGDGIGDLKGISKKIDYIENLGAKVVRLNSIFQSYHYPENYKNITSLMEIDKSLGTIQDFATLANNLHARNMSLVIDLPIYPFVLKMENIYNGIKLNSTDSNLTHKSGISVENQITTAIKFWISNGADGFYLKGAEHLIEDTHFTDSLKEWKKIIGFDRIFIISHDALLNARPHIVNSITYSIDLIDVFLDVSNGSQHIKSQVNHVLSDAIWTKPGCPWVHWSVGNIETKRLSSKIAQNNTLSAILMSMMLPGTPSIFYGDEVALRELSEPEEDYHESKKIHNLTPMLWPDNESQFTTGKVLPWLTSGDFFMDRVPFDNVKIIRSLADVRTKASSIYANAIWKDGMMLPNTQLRYSGKAIVVQRWYPRKTSYVFVSNLGKTNFNADLSSWFYGGTVVVSSNMELQGKEVVFKAIDLMPAEVIIIKLEK